jgi:MFS family permease
MEIFLKNNIYIFSVCFVLLIITTNLMESIGSSLLAKIIPPDWELGTLNAGFIITISTTTGNALGSFMLTISGWFGKDLILIITYGFCCLFFFVIIILVALNYSELRVKALARILKNTSYSKI